MSGLRLENVSRSFGDVRALTDASLRVERGTVHALLGENGAGKTTLIRIAGGELHADAGRIEVDGRAMRFTSPAGAMRAGIGVVHQHFALVPALTVAENVALGGAGRFDRRAISERIRRLGDRTGLVVDPDATVAELAVGARQRVEILKALSRETSILLLDEPTAVLTPAEAAALLQWLRSFADAGGAVVLITHKLREALHIADAITVLRHGRSIVSSMRADVDERGVAAAMLGEVADVVPAASLATAAGVDVGPEARVEADVDRSPTDAVRQVSVRAVVVELDGAGASATGRPGLRPTTLRIHAGEIVTVAGVEGSGERELLRLLAGRLNPTTGAVRRTGVVGFIPEDRQAEGLVLPFTLSENVALNGAGGRRGWIRWRSMRDRARRILEEQDVRARDADVPAGTLSGGNQQKLIIGRALMERPALIVAENPTRGLDIRATGRVHSALRDAARAGAAVVIYSSDLDEVIAFGERVLVAHQGSITEAPRDRSAVGRAMLGVA